MIFSPVHKARADTTIEECIRIMRDNKIGAILIVSDDFDETLVGIFTERDVLTKIELIQKGSHWTRPVRTVMTKTLRTLPPERASEATALMVKYNIRHVPIVINDEQTAKPRIVGILSMRDLFKKGFAHHSEMAKLSKSFANLAPPLRSEKPVPVNIGVYTSEFSIFQFIQSALSKKSGLDIKRLPSKLLSEKSKDFSQIKKLKALFFDIDEHPPLDWIGFLKQVLSKDDFPELRVILLFDPIKHHPKEIELLNKLEKNNNRFTIYQKPIDIVAFSELKFLN